MQSSGCLIPVSQNLNSTMECGYIKISNYTITYKIDHYQNNSKVRIQFWKTPQSDWTDERNNYKNNNFATEASPPTMNFYKRRRKKITRIGYEIVMLKNEVWLQKWDNSHQKRKRRRRQNKQHTYEKHHHSLFL